MVAAGIRALVINGAQAAFTIQVHAVIVAHPGQGENPRLLVEALDDAFLLQAFSHVLRRFVFFELVDHADSDQILDLHLHRQGAAGRMAAMAHVAGIALPGLQAVDFGRGDQGRFHLYRVDHGLGARDDTGIVQFMNNLLPESQRRHENCEP